MAQNDRYSRFQQKAKRKKTNVILNSLIGVVVLLIVIVGAAIFMNSSPKDRAQTDQNISSQSKTNSNKDSNNSSSHSKSDSTANQDSKKNKEKTKEDQVAKNKNEDSSKDETINSNDAVVTEGTEPNIKQTVDNPNWKPVGTTQSGEHVSSYDESTQDWKEKIQAISYATGLTEDQMTLWYMENGGGPDKAIGTVTSKDQSQIYRVYLQWEDGRGWKPSRVDQLEKNDKQ
jgi:cytoskeletal protein RodZ